MENQDPFKGTIAWRYMDENPFKGTATLIVFFYIKGPFKGTGLAA